jgi:hypothetical protein
VKNIVRVPMKIFLAKMKSFKKYVIKHDEYDWRWNGERWTVAINTQRVYTKKTLPTVIKYMLLVSVGDDICKWYYEGENRKAFIIRYEERKDE